LVSAGLTKVYPQQMKIKGIVFDFNGTLFWDTNLHNTAWDRFLEMEGIYLNDVQKNERIHGKNNHDILRSLFDRPLSSQEMEEFILKKEGIYQSLCLKTEMRLAPGAIDFLEFLRTTGIPRAIATASGIENVNFYFEHLNLERFFDPSSVVYNDGSIPGKPDPGIFKKAIQLLGITEKETLVFEDSKAGIMAAENAGVGMIIIVNSGNGEYSRWKHPIVGNFNEVDKSIFL
jgi:beta-phosphoglucomutase